MTTGINFCATVARLDAARKERQRLNDDGFDEQRRTSTSGYRHLLRDSLTLPRKRKLKLLHESVRNVVAKHAVFLRPELVAFHRRAEDVIEECVVRRVVAVERRLILAVVPVVKVGRDDDVAQRAQAHADVGVIEHGLKTDDQDIGVDHFFRKTEHVNRGQHKRTRDEQFENVLT